MRILQVIPSFYPAHVYGGPIQSVYRLSCQLARRGHEVRVLTTDANGRHGVLDVVTDREVAVGGALRVRYCKRWMAESVAPTLLGLLPGHVGWADIVHLTAVYSFPTIPTLLVSSLRDKPVVWSPRGAFQRWEGSTRWLVKGAWEWACRRLRPRRLVLHATSAQEAAESAGRAGGVETAVIANGVDLPKLVPKRPKWVLTPEQAQRLLETLSPMSRSLVGLSLLTGMRRGELWSLLRSRVYRQARLPRRREPLPRAARQPRNLFE